MAVHFDGAMADAARRQMELELSGTLPLGEQRGHQGGGSRNRQHGGDRGAGRHDGQYRGHRTDQPVRSDAHTASVSRVVLKSDDGGFNHPIIVQQQPKQSAKPAAAKEEMILLRDMELDVTYWRATRIDVDKFNPDTFKVRKTRGGIFSIPVRVTARPYMEEGECIVEGEHPNEVRFDFA